MFVVILARTNQVRNYLDVQVNNLLTTLTSADVRENRALALKQGTFAYAWL